MGRDAEANTSSPRKLFKKSVMLADQNLFETVKTESFSPVKWCSCLPLWKLGSPRVRSGTTVAPFAQAGGVKANVRGTKQGSKEISAII